MEKIIQDLEKRIKELQKKPTEMNIILISELHLILKRLNRIKYHKFPTYSKMFKSRCELSLINEDVQEYKSADWSCGFLEGYIWTIQNTK